MSEPRTPLEYAGRGDTDIVIEPYELGVRVTIPASIDRSAIVITIRGAVVGVMLFLVLACFAMGNPLQSRQQMTAMLVILAVFGLLVAWLVIAIRGARCETKLEAGRWGMRICDALRTREIQLDADDIWKVGVVRSWISWQYRLVVVRQSFAWRGLRPRAMIVAGAKNREGLDAAARAIEEAIGSASADRSIF